MARYDYRCPHCHTVFEVEHAMSETPKVTCPTCGTEASRVFEASSISLKGSGFYNTDMRDGKGGATPATAEPPSSESSGAKGSEDAGSSSAKEAASTDSGAASSSPTASED